MDILGADELWDVTVPDYSDNVFVKSRRNKHIIISCLELAIPAKYIPCPDGLKYSCCLEKILY